MVAPVKLFDSQPPPRRSRPVRVPAGLVRFAAGVGSLALMILVTGASLGAVAAVAWHTFHWLT